eukprot:896427-Ditylum_brightwellii.AAC.1
MDRVYRRCVVGLDLMGESEINIETIIEGQNSGINMGNPLQDRSILSLSCHEGSRKDPCHRLRYG